jgi:hypothetical protein
VISKNIHRGLKSFVSTFSACPPLEHWLASLSTAGKFIILAPMSALPTKAMCPFALYEIWLRSVYALSVISSNIGKFLLYISRRFKEGK